jgi:hypothetical protein
MGLMDYDEQGKLTSPRKVPQRRFVKRRRQFC